MKNNNKGFSLIELLVVIAIMAILAGVGVAGYTIYTTEAQKGVDQQSVAQLTHAIDIAYKGGTLTGADASGIIVITNNGTTAAGSDAFKKALVDALGEDYVNTKLAYGDWGAGNLPSFMNNADALWNQVSDVATDFKELASSLVGIEDEDELVAAVAYEIADVSKEEFMKLWNGETVEIQPGTNVTDLSGSMMRGLVAIYARNSCLAEYVCNNLNVNDLSSQNGPDAATIRGLIKEAISNFSNGELSDELPNYSLVNAGNVMTAQANIGGNMVQLSQMSGAFDANDLITLVNSYESVAASDGNGFYESMAAISDITNVQQNGNSYTSNSDGLISTVGSSMATLSQATQQLSNVQGLNENAVVIVSMMTGNDGIVNYIVLPATVIS